MWMTNIMIYRIHSKFVILSSINSIVIDDNNVVWFGFGLIGMGMTLKLDDLRAALLMPKELAAGFILQYTVN